MSKKFHYVDGGIGRMLCAYSAASLTNTIIVSDVWGDLANLFDVDSVEPYSNAFNMIIGKNDIFSNDPYHLYAYRSGKITLHSAFIKTFGHNPNDYPDYPIFKPDTQQREHYRQIMEENVTGNGVYVGVQCVSGSTDKNLNTDHFKNIINACFDLGLTPVLLDDNDYDHTIIEDERIVVLPERNTYEYISSISACDLFIGPESSGMHVARACDIPGIIFHTITAGINSYPNNFTHFTHPDYPNTLPGTRVYQLQNKMYAKNNINGVTDYIIKQDEIVEALKGILS